MKILLIGGKWDLNKGEKNFIVDEIKNLIKGDVTILNGGNYNDLERFLKESHDYDIICNLADIDKNLPYLDIKKISPYVMLVSSKLSDDNTSFKELMSEILVLKANLMVEYKFNKGNISNIMIFDPLGNVWYEGTDIKNAIEKSLNRLGFLMNITREKTIKSEINKNLVMNWYFDRFKQKEYRSKNIVNFPEESEFIELVKNYSTRFYEIMKPDDGKKLMESMNIKKLPPQVFRCAKGMPSYRFGKYIIVSKRNINNKFIISEDLIPTYIEDNKLYYCGEDKPSIDTPIHIRLYEKLDNINYILHSHNYVDGAFMTNTSIPCGAIEEVDEILRVIEENYDSFNENKYVINLKGHGSIIMGNSVNDLKGINYIGRKMPEKMED